MPEVQYFIGKTPVFTAEDIVSILDKELVWCVEHPGAAGSEEVRAGYIKGLTQAKYIITRLAEVMSQEQR